MIWYQVDTARYRVRAKIEPVEVVKVTDKTLTIRTKSVSWHTGKETINDSRNAKVSDWHCFFPSWQEAHAYLMDSAANHVHRAKLALEQAKAAEGNVKGMKPPQNAQD